MIAIVSIAFTSFPISAALALGPYYVTDFGTLPNGGEAYWARDINSVGQVVGNASAAGNEQAFLWQPDSPNGITGQLHALVDLEEGGNSLAFAVNDTGQVVGRSSIGSDERAFLWHPIAPNSTSGAAYDLGSLPGGSNRSSANGINGVGQIVGYSQTSTGVRAFLWQPSSDNSTSGVLIDLGDLPGGEDYSVGHGISDSGQVVGSSWAEDERRPFIWSPTAPNSSTGTLHDLGDLDGGRVEGGAIAINSAGQIVGHSSAASGFRGFWTDVDAPVSGLLDLGDLPGGIDYSLARDINNHGQIVGVGAKNELRAVAWKDPTNLVDLNDVLDPISGAGWKLTYASGVNDAGQIVGYGTLNGTMRGFLLTPIPVPAPEAATLATIPAVLMVAIRRRQAAGVAA